MAELRSISFASIEKTEVRKLSVSLAVSRLWPSWSCTTKTEWVDAQNKTSESLKSNFRAWAGESGKFESRIYVKDMSICQIYVKYVKYVSIVAVQVQVCEIALFTHWCTGRVAAFSPCGHLDMSNCNVMCRTSKENWRRSNLKPVQQANLGHQQNL
jgi:hypothetical protein